MKHKKPKGVKKLISAVTIVLVFSIGLSVLSPNSRVAAAGTPPDSTGSESCGTSNTMLTWIICPVFYVVRDAADVLNNAITDLLEIKTNPIFGGTQTGSNYGNAACDTTKTGSSCNAYRNAWSDMRNIALIIIVIAGLVMIIAQAVGSQAVDAYTIKSVMPRLLIAAIFIALSWIVMNFMVTLSDYLGEGIRTLIYAPFSTLNATTAGHTIGATNGVGGYAEAAGGILGGIGTVSLLTVGLALFVSGGVLLSFAAALALGLLIGFLVVVLRQVLITFLIIVAPIAIACYALPNTKKAFSMWWDNLFKALMMFPIIIAFIAAGRVFSLVSFSEASNAGGESVLFAMVALVAYIIPYFMLPFTFKMAGSAMGGIAQGLHGALAKPRAMLRKRGMQQAAKTGKERLERTRNERYFKGGNANNLRGRMNKRLARTANADAIFKNGSWYKPSQWSGAIGEAMGVGTANEIEETLKNDKDYARWSGNDTVNRAAAESHDDASFRARLKQLAPNMTDAEVEQNAMRVNSLRRKMSVSAFRQMTTLQAMAGGTAYENADEAWAGAAMAAAGDDAATAYMVKNGREALMKAGRVDQGGASFGTTLGAVKKIQDDHRRNGSISQRTRDEVNESIYGGAIDSSPPGQALYGKPGSAKHLAGAHARKIDSIIGSLNSGRAINIDGPGKPPRVATETDLKQAMASANGLYHAMQSASPQNAREFADGLIGHDFNVSTLPPKVRAALALRPGATSSTFGNIPMIQAFENLAANDRDFNDMSYNYASQAAQQAAAAGAAPPPGPAPAPGGPLGGPGPVGGPPSDRRLKKNIKHLITQNGIKLYQFQYIWSDEIYVGVMAQDLVNSHPEALTIDNFGYYRVSYAVLGLKMMSLEEWLSTGHQQATTK